MIMLYTKLIHKRLVFNYDVNFRTMELQGKPRGSMKKMSFDMQSRNKYKHTNL